MVDIHCHILPGLDDGPETLDVAKSMVALASAAGTTDMVATPHANHDYPFSPEQVAAKIAELREATGNIVKIHSGCDFHLSAENIQDALSKPTKYTINHGSYILVEFSDFMIPPTIDAIFNRMRTAGMIPIITHPERNRLLYERIDQIRTWVADTCYVQVTAQSFLGRFGKEAKAFTDTLMKNGLIHIVASDGHDPTDRPPVLGDSYSHVAKTYGEARAQALFITNPRSTITGEAIELFQPRPTRRTWFVLNRNGHKRRSETVV